MKNKPTKKQTQKRAKRRHSQDTRGRRQATQAQELLWREMEPRIGQTDLDNEEEWYDFASHVMADSAALCDEPEFDGLLFDPADALYMVTAMYNLYVPSPEELEQLPEDEHDDIISEAHIHAVAEFVTSDLQRDVLDALRHCRRRLRREKDKDKLALSAAVEWLLGADMRPDIWSTCGILHRVLQDSVNVAFELEEKRADALKLAQAIQPDVEDEYDLDEDTPAGKAFWGAVEDSPDLLEYIERRAELEDSLLDTQHQLDSELATELLDVEEIEQFLDAMVQSLRDSNIDMEAIGDMPDPATGKKFIEEQLPLLVKDMFPSDRFQELMEDLQEIVETAENEFEPKIARAQMLYNEFSTQDVPYWSNSVFAQFLFNAAIAEMGLDLDSDEDEYDEDEYDEDEYDEDGA